MRYQGHVSNSIIWFIRVCDKSYGRGRGPGFNLMKLKVWGECEALGSDVYYIVYSRKSDKYTKTAEAILNYIQGNFNKGNDLKEALEEINHFEFNIIKPKTPY